MSGEPYNLERTFMISIISKYQQEVLPKLKNEYGLKNDLSAPIIDKIVINTSVIEAMTNKDAIAKVSQQLAAISGQQPKFTKAKAAIAGFKLRKGDIIGAAVTLRKKRAWYFLEKFISIVVPRMRDFRGVTKGNFDKMGNFNLGLSEQIIFPEIDYSKIDKIRGLSVSIVIKNSNPEKSQKLFELLGLPFKEN